MCSVAVRSGDAQVLPRAVARINRLIDQICDADGRDRISLMEVCGTHTMAISGHGIRKAVDGRLRLLSGPGCPVCVTTQEEIDAAIALAFEPGVAMVTFGDMMKVPGYRGSLEQAKAKGADVRVVYSVLDGLRQAMAEVRKQFVFLGVGFETTAPTAAAAILQARDRRASNFLLLSMFKLIPPALRVIAESDRTEVDGFILPGHVSTVIGARPYEFLAVEHGLPCCVAGFDAADVLQAIIMLLEQMRRGPRVEVQYRRSVHLDGNPEARRVMDDVFRVADAGWRGIGVVPASGLELKRRFAEFDARKRFDIKQTKPRRTGCRCGDVMLGLIAPTECALFSTQCTPENPVGPCMVSSEGACAAYYRYERNDG